MNTLSRAITAQFFPAPTDYTALRTHWSRVVNSKLRYELEPVHYLLYLALLGKDWRKAFTPITNSNKLENGAFVKWSLFRALAVLHSQVNEGWVLAPFGEQVTPVTLQTVRDRVASFNCYTYPPEAFAAGKFPCEAYRIPPELEVCTTGKAESNA